jgi:thiol:disulfide interchange protein DsbD
MSQRNSRVGHWLAVVLTWCTATVALAQAISFGGADEQVKWSLKAVPGDAKPGDAVEVRVTANIARGWHIYSLNPVEEETGPLPTSITLDTADLVPEGKLLQPTPTRKMDNAFGIVVESFETRATFTQRFRVPVNATAGTRPLAAKVRFMVCNDRSCLPPTTVDVAGLLNVVASVGSTEPPKPDTAAVVPPKPTTPKEPQPANASPSPADATAQVLKPSAKKPVGTPPSVSARPAVGSVSAVQAAKAAGFWAYLGFAISVGFLALLTPCVFPMIPITVSFFTKKEGLTRTQGLVQALIYCAGIVATFTGLGIALALAFGAAAIQGVASNVWVNGLIAVVFVVFALNLFGAYEIRVPYRLLGFLGEKSSGSGTVATLLMGLTFTLTSFTCTVPFVGTVLVGATQGELFWALTGMLGFSAAFASPFFLLALFPQMLASLPKSGGWLNAVKVTMGFLELAAALKFLSNIDLVLGWRVLPREMFLAVWVALAFVAAIYLLGKIRLPLDTPVEQLGVVRMLWGVAFFAVGFYLWTGLGGKPLGELDAFLPPYTMDAGVASLASGTNLKAEPEMWLQRYDDALVEAKRSNRPVFIDFTGVTCTNCRWMEKNIFARADVSALMRDFVLVQLWTDKADAESRANQEMQKARFRTVALPFYAILSPNDEVLATFDGLTRNPEEFKAFLQSGQERFAAVAMTPFD